MAAVRRPASNLSSRYKPRSSNQKTVSFNEEVLVYDFIPDLEDRKERQAHFAMIRKNAHAEWKQWKESGERQERDDIVDTNTDANMYAIYAESDPNTKELASSQSGTFSPQATSLVSHTDATERPKYPSWWKWSSTIPLPAVDSVNSTAEFITQSASELSQSAIIEPFTGTGGQNPRRWMKRFENVFGYNKNGNALNVLSWLDDFDCHLDYKAAAWADNSYFYQKAMSDAREGKATVQTVMDIKNLFFLRFHGNRQNIWIPGTRVRFTVNRS